jgi:hypothetical protein
MINSRMWANHVARMGRRGEGKRLLGGPRRRWEDNVMMEHEETGWSGIDRIRLVGWFACLLARNRALFHARLCQPSISDAAVSKRFRG